MDCFTKQIFIICRVSRLLGVCLGEPVSCYRDRRWAGETATRRVSSSSCPVQQVCSTVYFCQFNTIDYRNRIESFEMWCSRKMLGISWKEHRTNISMILEEIGPERELMGKVARMKLQYFGHIIRGSAGNLALTVLEGSIDGLHHQGRPKRQWMDDIEEWIGCSYIQLKEMSQDREQWRRKTIEWSSAVANRHWRWSTSEWVS